MKRDKDATRPQEKCASPSLNRSGVSIKANSHLSTTSREVIYVSSMAYVWGRRRGARDQAATVPCAVAEDPTFSTLYKFEAPAATTFTSALGSQPDTLPVVGPDGAIYGMTSVGGQYGNGVIYRFDRNTHQYTVLHTFSALNANGENADGATPGMALTRGPGDVIYGMASFGGQNGSGTIFKIRPSGEFTVLYTFSALNANGNNPDGAYPLRAMVAGNDGGPLRHHQDWAAQTLCLFTQGCGVAWMIDTKGNFKLSIRSPPKKATQRRCCWGRTDTYMAARCGRPLPCPPGLCPPGSCTGWRHRGKALTCSTRSARPTRAARTWMAPTATSRLSNRDPASFMGRPFAAEQMATVSCSGIPSRTQGSVEVVHDFSALNSAGQNWDGAAPGGRLALGPHGTLSSNTESGGANGNGVIYSLREDGQLQGLAHLQCNECNHRSQ